MNESFDAGVSCGGARPRTFCATNTAGRTGDLDWTLFLVEILEVRMTVK